ncbi:MAG: sulfotransferase domain-containing protein [Candidatus Omnitrophica bacterium]|nr:sulfotransferase domain-containing protein [Candidatus Omnitrophota bacterium]
MKKNKELRAFFGHHKAATTWIHRLIKDICVELKWKMEVFYSPKGFDCDLGGTITKKCIDFVCYVNADMRYLKSIPKFKGFHIVRDLRDSAVSAYFSHRNSHRTVNWPELVAHREKLGKLSMDDGLLADMEFTRKLSTDGIDLYPLDCMRDWDYSLPNIMEVRYEDVFKDPYKQFIEIFKFLDMVDEESARSRNILKYLLKKHLHHGGISKIPYWRLLAFLHDYDFSRKSGGRKKGQTDEKSHLRKGIAGDWRNYFKEVHKEWFKKNYNDLLIKLGYEKSENW